MQVSRQSISKKQWEEWWEKLMSVFSERRAKELSMIFGVILAKNEKIMMAKRLMIGYLILSSVNPEIISKEVKVSISTVYKYKTLIEMNPEFRAFLAKTLPKKTTKKSSIQTDFDRFMSIVARGKIGK